MAIDLPPNVTQDPNASNTTVCAGGTANLQVLASATSGGTLMYAWEVSVDGGSTWTAITDGGIYSGTSTSRLSINNAVNNYRFRAIITESGNANPATSDVFTTTVVTPTPPTAVTISGNSTVCVHAPLQLTSSVTGGTNILYQWQRNISGVYTNIPGATYNTYSPSTAQTGVELYRLSVSGGSGCGAGIISAVSTITVNGISSTSSSSFCGSGSASLTATANSGTVTWYDADVSGNTLATGNSYTTPTLTGTTTYYVAASGCSAGLRVPVPVMVYPATSGGSVQGGSSVVQGNNSTTLYLQGSTGSVIRWQSSTDHFNTVINNIDATTTWLTINNLNQTTQYRAEVRSGTCANAFTAAGIITVSGILPVRAGSLKATLVNEGALIEWIAYDQANTALYEIERSVNGISFEKTGSVLPHDVQLSSVSYHWLDRQLPGATVYYRIKEITFTGESYYTAIVKLSGKNRSAISVFPNPVSGRSVQLKSDQLATGIYAVRVYNQVGQVIYLGTIRSTGGSGIHLLELPASAKPGIYQLEVSGGSMKYTTSVLVL